MSFDSGKAIPAYVLAAASVLLSACQPAPGAKPIPVLYGEEASIGYFYWVDQTGCRSNLRRVEDFTITAGDTSDLDFRIERGLMVPPWQCLGTRVPGASILVRQKQPVAAPTPVTISFVVHYLTLDGQSTTSTHTKHLVLEPEGRRID